MCNNGQSARTFELLNNIKTVALGTAALGNAALENAALGNTALVTANKCVTARQMTLNRILNECGEA